MPQGRLYAALEFLAACRGWPNPVTVVTRLRLDAALYAPAPPRAPGQLGRPRLKGERLPTLAAVAAEPATSWTTVTVADWYGEGSQPALSAAEGSRSSRAPRCGTTAAWS